MSEEEPKVVEAAKVAPAEGKSVAPPNADVPAPQDQEKKAPAPQEKKATAPQEQEKKAPEPRKSVVDDGGEGGIAAGKWPDDWRDRLSKGDEKRASMLSRYASVEALADKLIEQDKLIGKGIVSVEPPKDATPERMAAWRKERGVPETPDKYSLPEGFVVGESDKPLFDSFFAKSHKANIDDKTMKVVMEGYKESMLRAEQERAEADDAYAVETTQVLREEYGPAYKRTVNAVKAMVATHFGDAAGELLNGRTASGRIIGDDPAVIRALASLALQLNPAAAVVESGRGNDAQAELESIRETRRSDPDKYYKNQAMQARFRELITAVGAGKSE